MRKEIAILALASLFSCSQEIGVSVGEDIPVVYCLLDHDESTQYVRLAKSNKDYRDLNLEFEDNQPIMDVELVLIEEQHDGSHDFIHLEFIKNVSPESNEDAGSTYSLFSTNHPIKQSQIYTLIIFQNDNQQLCVGTTETLGSSIKIIDPIQVPGRDINISPSRDYYIRFSYVDNAFVYQATLYFNYDEIVEGFPNRKQIELPQDLVYPIDVNLRFLEQRVDGEYLFRQIAKKIEINEEATRVPIGMAVQVSCCGEEVYLSACLSLNENSFSIADYSNMAKAAGVFSSVNRARVNHLSISDLMKDSLALSPITQHLNFITNEGK